MSKKTPVNILDLYKPVRAQTANQKTAITSYQRGQHLLMTGFPGTGKTYLAMALAIESLRRGDQNQIIIVRSAVATRDIGYLPGNLKEKMQEYEQPYIDMCNSLFNTDNHPHIQPFKALMSSNLLRLLSTSYVRGMTVNNAVIILDEFQNMTEHEIHSVLSRVGKECRIIISGDISQTDLTAQRSGFSRLVNVLETMNTFTNIDFDIDDIVRSEFAKQFILCWSLSEPMLFERRPYDNASKDVQTQPAARSRATASAD